MPITLDIKDDFVYKKGKQEGIRQGKQEGKQEGIREGILNSLELRLPVAQIAQIFKVSVEYVKELQEELKK